MRYVLTIHRLPSHCGRAIADFDPATNQKQIWKALRDLAQLMEAISNYLIFNAMQARIVEFGNSAGLSML
ncbi:hypothetical protein JQK88_31045 [Mesorhizobium caraganae]|uniref:hypothetical protein n=1 Tax=Mesorhizobium caraganae TaxID=483206 RepID=UPI00193AD176|nr:hypothetical protein [Mesorhizobium caraganae]MBM2715562.1 hypothetical protein [Mesorhizobium caraganae]